MKPYLRYVGLAVAAFLVGIIAASFAKPKPQGEVVDAATSSGILSSINLPDTLENVRNGEEWLGKVVIINHWATWCPPCRKEIPLFIEYQKNFADKGLQIIGIAHEDLESVRIFGDEIGINYPSLTIGPAGSKMMVEQGNNAGVLPFTVVLNRAGETVFKKLGEFKDNDFQEQVLPLL